jgi:hypothetical protein
MAVAILGGATARVVAKTKIINQQKIDLGGQNYVSDT